VTVPQPTHQVVVCVFKQAAEGPRYLVVRRDRAHEGLWRPILGTIRPAEVIEAAAIREVRDETGIISPRALIDFGFRRHEQIGDFDLVDWGVGYDVGNREPEIRLGAGCREFRWLAVEEAWRTIEIDPYCEAVLKLHLRLVG